MLLNRSNFKSPNPPLFITPELPDVVVAEQEEVTLKDGSKRFLTRTVVTKRQKNHEVVDGRGLKLDALVRSGYPPTVQVGFNFLSPSPEKVAQNLNVSLTNLLDSVDFVSSVVPAAPAAPGASPAAPAAPAASAV